MAIAVLAWLVAIPLLGFVTGLRTMTPIALLCWVTYLGYLPVADTWAFWTAHLAAVVIFTLLAVGEYIGDKLPKTPNRTSAGPLIARLVFGGLVGAIVAAGLKGSALEGIILGVAGAWIGAFGGYLIRRELVHRYACRDWQIAISEDILALGFALFALGIVTG
jgi:uncharacterized membrane protein